MVPCLGQSPHHLGASIVAGDVPVNGSSGLPGGRTPPTTERTGSPHVTLGPVGTMAS